MRMNLATINETDMASRRNETDERKWDAVLRRDRDFDGKFVFGVFTTGVYCRPSCPSRRPLRKNVEFFTSTDDARKAGLRACLRCKPDSESAIPEAVEKARQLLEAQGDDERITLETLAAQTGMSSFHLQRAFKKFFGMSPKDYQTAHRMRRFKHSARESASVTDAMLDAGFPNSRSFYEKAGALGISPKALARGAATESLRWTMFETSMGTMVAAISEKGLCALEFVTGETEANAKLTTLFPMAELERDDRKLASTVAVVRKVVDGGAPLGNIPLDLRGTAFQLAVWNYLRRIPAGETRSYAEVARAIRKPDAVRAVAKACATNKVAVVVPCHRVVRSGGEISGYKWGTERKRRLLDAEARRA